MSYVNVKFGQDCRSKIISGVNLCADAVQTTFGNNGTNSIILTSGGVKVTKDGYHTALEVNDADPYVTMGIKLVQDTCKLTAKSVAKFQSVISRLSLRQRCPNAQCITSWMRTKTTSPISILSTNDGLYMILLPSVHIVG